VFSLYSAHFTPPSHYITSLPAPRCTSLPAPRFPSSLQDPVLVEAHEAVTEIPADGHGEDVEEKQHGERVQQDLGFLQEWQGYNTRKVAR
jgi:hypothetical protein